MKYWRFKQEYCSVTPKGSFEVIRGHHHFFVYNFDIIKWLNIQTWNDTNVSVSSSRDYTYAIWPTWVTTWPWHEVKLQKMTSQGQWVHHQTRLDETNTMVPMILRYRFHVGSYRQNSFLPKLVLLFVWPLEPKLYIWGKIWGHVGGDWNGL